MPVRSPNSSTKAAEASIGFGRPTVVWCRVRGRVRIRVSVRASVRASVRVRVRARANLKPNP